MVTALMVKPGEKPCVVSLLDDEDYLNAVVSIGDTLMCTAAVLPMEKDVVVIYAWEGVMAGLKGNCKVGKRIIAGTFYVVRVIDGELRPLSEKDIASFSCRFREIQEYGDQEVMYSWFDDLWLAD